VKDLGIEGRHQALAQFLGWRQRAVAPVCRLVGTLGAGFKPGNRGDAPAKQPAEPLLRLAPQVADVPEDLGVPLVLFGDAFGEAGPFASHPALPPFCVRQGMWSSPPRG